MASASRPASAQTLSGQSTQGVAHTPAESRRLLPTSSTLVGASLPASSTRQYLRSHDSRVNQSHGDMHSSHTWTSASGDIGLLNDADEIEDRSVFVLEYNRLARKYRVRLLARDDFTLTESNEDSQPKRGWFQRMFRSSTGRPASAIHFDHRPTTQHRRSASDLAHLIHNRRDPPKSLDIHQMVRLSGRSALYLPLDYSPCSLVLPTCIRATGQYIAQHADTRGIFRVPGSMKVVGAIFDYYCQADKNGADISGTVRPATLPLHIHFSAHDIGSTFKRLLSVLPGGILGSLAIFDSFIAIHSQLHGEPENPRTKQSKVRARLIALAIGTIESQYRRELICAVFGLLSMIGRVAELAPREDEQGRALPTSDLMGYSALAIVFGPLLIGDLLQSYSMKLAAPDGGLLVLPPATQQVRRRVRKGHQRPNVLKVQPTVEKINVTISIAEMLISNWRDIVRQMKSLGTHHKRQMSSDSVGRASLKSSASETVLMRLPRDIASERSLFSLAQCPGHESDPETPTIMRPRSRVAPRRAASFLAQKPSMNTLSPTMEESPVETTTQEPRERNHGIKPSRQSSREHLSARLHNAKCSSTIGAKVSKDMVPPRSSSKDQTPQRTTSATQTAVSYHSDNDVEGTEPSQSPDPAMLLETTAAAVSRQNPSLKSFERTPPQFYSPEEGQDRTPQSLEGQNKTESMAMPCSARSADALCRQRYAVANGDRSSQTPQTDSKCEIRRYKRNNHAAHTGSPYRKPKSDRHSGSVHKMAAMFEGRSASGLDILGTRGLHAHDTAHQPSKLRKTKSGPMRTGDKGQLSPSVRRSSVQVWRNGVKQKGSYAKVLKSSKSDGNSLRTSALRDLFSPSKKRTNKYHLAGSFDPAIRSPISLDEKPDFWQASPVLGESVAQNAKENQSSSCKDGKPAIIGDDVEYLHRIIQCLRDRLLEERLKTAELKEQLRVEGMVEHKFVKDALEEAKLDIDMWRDKAQAAEKRLEVFEKFTARLRGIRDAAVYYDGSGSGSMELAEKDKYAGQDDYTTPLMTRVRFAETDGLDEKDKPLETTHCISDAGPDEYAGCPDATDKVDMRSLASNVSQGTHSRAPSLEEVADLWMAAKELLDMDTQDGG